MGAGIAAAMAAALGTKTEQELEKVKSDLLLIDETLNGGPAPDVIVMPNGYKSASYSNASGTNKYKWENNRLDIAKSASAGEINTGNASLTIDDSLVFVVKPEEHPKFVFSYQNGNADGVCRILLRFCRYNRLDYYDAGDIDVPTGTGNAVIDLVNHATQKGIDLTERYRVVIRGIWLAQDQETYANASVSISGFTVPGEMKPGLVDNVEELTEKNKAMATENRYNIRQNVPSYYFADPVSPASFDDMPYLEDAIARVPKGKSFIFLTDTHWESNAKNTFKLIQYVKNRLGIRKVLFGGDCIDRGTNKYVGLNLIRNYMNIAVDALGKDYIPTIGNHDTNMGNALNDNLDDPTYRIPYDQLYKVYLSHIEGDIHTEDWSETVATIAQSDADAAELTGWTKLHYYVDDAKDKTRYIVIYSSAYDLTLVPSYTGFSTDGGGGPTTVMQYEWFARTLMSTPAGYDIIVLAHCADAENKTFPERQVLRNYFDFFVRIASAFHKKCSGYKIDVSNFSEEGCPTNAFWTRETKQWDFTSAPDVGKILFMAGHIHKNVEYVSRIETDSTVYPTYERGKARNNGNPALVGVEEGVEVFDSATVDFSTGEMLTIISQNDAYNRVTANKYPYESEEMTQGTVTEQSFDVVTLTDNGVVCTRFGAGWDRTIPVKWLPTT